MNENNIKKNKRIITISTLILIFVMLFFVLINSTFNAKFEFVSIINKNTGESIGVVSSLFLYVLLWWFIGLFPSAIAFLFVLLLYYFLHRKDRRILERNYHPPYEEEYHYGGKIAFEYSYIATGIILILQIFNIINIF